MLPANHRPWVEPCRVLAHAPNATLARHDARPRRGARRGARRGVRKKSAKDRGTSPGSNLRKAVGALGAKPRSQILAVSSPHVTIRRPSTSAEPLSPSERFQRCVGVPDSRCASQPEPRTTRVSRVPTKHLPSATCRASRSGPSAAIADSVVRRLLLAVVHDSRLQRIEDAGHRIVRQHRFPLPELRQQTPRFVVVARDASQPVEGVDGRVVLVEARAERRAPRHHQRLAQRPDLARRAGQVLRERWTSHPERHHERRALARGTSGTSRGLPRRATPRRCVASAAIPMRFVRSGSTFGLSRIFDSRVRSGVSSEVSSGAIGGVQANLRFAAKVGRIGRWSSSAPALCLRFGHRDPPAERVPANATAASAAEPGGLAEAVDHVPGRRGAQAPPRRPWPFRLLLAPR